MARATESYTTPPDVLGARLVQAAGALAAITAQMECGSILDDSTLLNALWAVEELLQQARNAFDDMGTSRLAIRERRLRAVQ